MRGLFDHKEPKVRSKNMHSPSSSFFSAWSLGIKTDRLPLGCWVSLLLVLLIAGPGCSRKSKQARYLARANEDFAAERYDRAELEYTAARKLAPLDPTAISKLGLLYFAQGRFLQAHAFLQEAIRLQPDNAEARLKLGLSDLSLGQPNAAWNEAARVFQQQPTNEEAMLLLSTAASTNQVQETWQRIETLPQWSRGSAGYKVARGFLYLHEGKLEPAEAEFKAALASDPKSSAAYSALATIYLVRKDLKQAEPALKAAAEFSPPRSNHRLHYASFKYEMGATNEAASLLEEMTKGAPDYLPAWNLLARIAFNGQRNEECSGFLTRVLARDPMNYDALMMRGNLLLARGEGTNAVIHFDKLSKAFPRAAQVYYRLAMAHLVNRDVGKAIVALNQALGVDSKLPEAILLLSELDLRRGDTAQAIAALSALTRQQPRLTQAYLLLATAYRMQKSPDQALAIYHHLAGLFPKDPQFPVSTGVVLAQANRKPEARQAFEAALELSPNYFPALEYLVELDLSEKNYAAALDRIKKQIERSPAIAEPWLLKANVHMAQAAGLVAPGKSKTSAGPPKLQFADVPLAKPHLDQAEAALKRALELNPNLQTAYMMLARLYVSCNKYQQALEDLAGLAAKTNNASAFMQIGQIHDELKEFPAARDAYEKVLSITPNATAALNNLACLYSEHLDQQDKAYKLGERARELSPYDGYTADTLGWILYRRGEYTRAVGLLQESAFKLPDAPEVQYHLGMTQYMLGEEEAARIALQKALQADLDFPGKEEARRRLALLQIDVKTTNAAVMTEIEKRLRETPGDPIALIRLAAIQERDGALDQAAKTYETALKRNPQNARLMLRLAEFYSDRMHNPVKGLALAKEAHSLAPQDARVSFLLGHLVFQSGDYQWAVNLLGESVRKFPNDLEVLYDYAWACYSVGRISEAQTSMQSVTRAATPSPKIEEAKRFIALSVAAASPAEAVRMASEIQKVLTADPNYLPALMASALIQEQRGSFKDAAALYERILMRYPLFVPATRNLALLCAERLGDEGRAYTLASKARESFPEDALLARTLGIVVYHRGDYARCAQLLEDSARRQNPDADLLCYLGLAQYHVKELTSSKTTLKRALAFGVQPKLADEAKRVLAELK